MGISSRQLHKGVSEMDMFKVSRDMRDLIEQVATLTRELDETRTTYVDTVEAMLRAAMPNGDNLSQAEFEDELMRHSSKPSEYIAKLKAGRDDLYQQIRDLKECIRNLIRVDAHDLTEQSSWWYRAQKQALDLISEKNKS